MTQCEGLLLVRSPTGRVFKSASDHMLPVMQNPTILDAIARALPPPLPRFVRSPEAVARRLRRREARLAAAPHAHAHAHAHVHAHAPAVVDVLEVPADAFPEALDVSAADPIDLAAFLGG